MPSSSVKEVVVECYAGSTYPERPRAFEVNGRRYVVAEVERQWRTPKGIAFRVRTEEGRYFLSLEGRRFVLFYDEAADQWSAVPD
jgi:hypothetical protein